ncbi:MAG: tRNA pseudouridine(38-40) synthase TruA, partial [Clostridiales bacterium]|nr:tRNA pseudouridine(38-40) synthase TruA [Clostridiales bacterium]
YKITVSYDGAGFCGWQSQPNGESVQDAIETAVEKLFGARPNVVGSGRTDAGVHALAQVAHFDSDKTMPLKNVVGGLNAYLPDAVRVMNAEYVESDFDARKSVKRKTYMYVMYKGACTPLLEPRALRVDELDVAAMNRAAQELVGKHDFATFKAAGSGAKTSTRTVFDAHVEEKSGLYLFFITADGFLYNMVRIITAQLVKVGMGENVDMKALIEKRDRTAAKETAPAKGLYLYRVDYNS